MSYSRLVPCGLCSCGDQEGKEEETTVVESRDPHLVGPKISEDLHVELGLVHFPRMHSLVLHSLCFHCVVFMP